MTNSIWAETCELPEFPRLNKNIETDVLIIGGGLAGLLCAHALTRMGMDCVVVEADRICHGVTRNTTGKVTAQHELFYHTILRRFGRESARLYYEANREAVERYRRLAEQFPCDFEVKDSYVYSLDRPHLLEKELRAMEKIGAPVEFVEKLPLPFPTAGGLRLPGQAQFHPLNFAAGLAQELHIYERTPVRSYDGRRYVTKGGKIKAVKTIVATHFPIFNKHGGYPFKLYQHRSYVLALENAPDLGGMYVDERENGLSFRNYGDLLLLGGGSHRTGKEGGGWQELEAFARTHFPGARERCRWATQDCMSLDNMPYIGRYGSNTSGLFVATGFNKWGMTSSMVAAMLLCDLVLGRGNRYAPLLTPGRTILRPQLFANGFESVSNLLTPSRHRCPHMGCALQWNRHEHTWDCPCHGSRFTREGKLVDSPATGNLPRK